MTWKTIRVCLNSQGSESIQLKKYELVLLPCHTTDDVKELVWYNSENYDLVPECLTLTTEQATFPPGSMSVKLSELLPNGSDVIEFQVVSNEAEKCAKLPPLRFADISVQTDSQVVNLREPMTSTVLVLKRTLQAHDATSEIVDISLHYADDPTKSLEDEQSLDDICGIDLPPNEALRFVASISFKRKGYYQLGSHEMDFDNLIVVDQPGHQPYALVNSRFLEGNSMLPELRVSNETRPASSDTEEETLPRPTATRENVSLRRLFNQFMREVGSRFWRLTSQRSFLRFYKLISHLVIVSFIWGVVFFFDVMALPRIMHWALFCVFLSEIVFTDSALQNIDDFVALDVGYNSVRQITNGIRRVKSRIYSAMDEITMRAVKFGMGSHIQNHEAGAWVKGVEGCIRAAVLCLITIIPRGHHLYNQELLTRMMVPGTREVGE